MSESLTITYAMTSEYWRKARAAAREDIEDSCARSLAAVLKWEVSAEGGHPGMTAQVVSQRTRSYPAKDQCRAWKRTWQVEFRSAERAP